MPLVLEYLLKFSISLAVLYIFYRFVLRPLTFYQWNRFYLGLYSLLSFIIPFINITAWISENENNRLLHAIPSIGNSQLLLANSPGSWWAIVLEQKWQLILLVLVAGSVFMLLKIVYQYFSLQMIKRKAVMIESSFVKLYDVNSNISPFSFANSIFINRKLHTDEELQKILQHEFVHVKQKHTADILIGELLVIINWFNPFAWLMRKAIKQNLEFIADDNVLKTGLDARQYQYLLLKVVGIPQYGITNNFNFSSLKKRIIMMNKMKTAKVHLVKFLFIVPLLAVMLVAFRQNNERAVQQKVSDLLINKSTEDTVPVPPPPPPIVEVRHFTAKPTPPSKPKLPENVNSITISTKSSATVKLKNGTKETYDLSNPQEKARYEKKYGKIVPPPPPPPAPVVSPVPALSPVPAVEPVEVRHELVALPPTVKIRGLKQGSEPLVILDGVILPEYTDLNSIDPESIRSIDVLKGDNATNAFGKKGENGVIMIKSTPGFVKADAKKTGDVTLQASSIEINKLTGFTGLVIINGKESTKEALSKIEPGNIIKIDVLKDESATRLYNDKGKNGVIIITTK